MNFLGCSSKCSVEEYEDYFKSINGKFSKRVERSSMALSVTWHPVELYAARQLKFDTSMSLDTVMNTYNNSLLFSVELEYDKNLSAYDYNRLIRNHFFKRKEFFLLNDKDTIYSVTYRMERSYQSNAPNRFIITFPRTEIKGSAQQYELVLRDLPFSFGTVSIGCDEIIGNVKTLKG